MSRERMLLDRLEVMEREPGRARAKAAEDIELVLKSVQRNLTRLFNARHGMCETVPDYGLPAPTDTGFNRDEAERVVLESIRTAVERYEPRLKRVRVTRVREDERAQRMVFRLDAVLMAGGGEQRIWYQAGLGGSGRFEVSE